MKEINKFLNEVEAIVNNSSLSDEMRIHLIKEKIEEFKAELDESIDLPTIFQAANLTTSIIKLIYDIISK